MMTFSQRLNKRIREVDSRVCLGIDPRPEAHPLTHPEQYDNDPTQVAKAVVIYFRDIIEATLDLVACYKLQSAFFEALGIPGLIAMAQLIADIKSQDVPVILDAKRGDIGSTSQAYASQYLTDTAFSADALTINPYLGMDGLAPFINTAIANGTGVFILVKTSNPGSRDFQDLRTEGGIRLYERVADKVAMVAQQHLEEAQRYSAIGAVVGATHPDELVQLRQRLAFSPLLIPGYGAQGGTAEDVAYAFDQDGLGAVVSSSRALTYGSEGEDIVEVAQETTQAMRDAINDAIEAVHL